MLNKLILFLDNNPKVIYFLLVVIGLIAYLVNLGLLPLFADEPTRAVVALEMIFSGNYWVPKINDGYYFSKPPLYNWIIAGTFLITGNMSEFASFMCFLHFS